MDEVSLVEYERHRDFFVCQFNRLLVKKNWCEKTKEQMFVIFCGWNREEFRVCFIFSRDLAISNPQTFFYLISKATYYEGMTLFVNFCHHWRSQTIKSRASLSWLKMQSVTKQRKIRHIAWNVLIPFNETTHPVMPKKKSFKIKYSNKRKYTRNKKNLFWFAK